MYDIDKKTHN